MSILKTIRRDSATALEKDGDYQVALSDDKGRIYVNPGFVADGAAADGEPMLMGGVAIEIDGSSPGSVNAAEMAFLRTDLNRRLLVSNTHPFLWSANDNGATTETDTVIKTAPGAGLSLYITDIIYTAAAAGTLTVSEDPGGGSEAVLLGPHQIAAAGGFTKSYGTPIKLTTNLALGYTMTGSGQHTLSIVGYIAP